MEVVGLLDSNGTPLVRRYQVGETMAVAGVPLTVAGSGGYGLKLASTTAAANCFGISMNAVTTVTAQQSDNSDPSRSVAVVVSPNAIVRGRLSGSGTTGVALVEQTEVTGTSTGLIADSTTDFSNPSYDEGGVFWSSGANKGPASFRKIITGDATDCDVGVAWPVDPAVGDKFVVVPFSTYDLQYVELTTTLDEINTSVAVDTNNGNFIPFAMQFPANFGRVLTDTAVLMTIADHIYASS